MIRSNYFSLAIVCILNMLTIAHATNALKERVEPFIEQHLPNEQVGIVIQQANNGDILYYHLADSLFYPASGTKLFSSAAALKKLGKDFRFETNLYAKDQSIYLKFSGDPSLTEKNLDHLIAQLKQRNIKTIKGHFVIDDHTFATPWYGAGWTWESIPWYYSAPVSSIVINENKANLKILKSKQLNQPISFEYGDAFPSLQFKTNVLSVTKEAAQNDCALHVEQHLDVYQLGGCWPQERTPFTLQLALQDPSIVAIQAIKQALQNNGIKLKGRIVIGKVPNEAQLIDKHQSPPLSELLKTILQDSNNLYADAVTKTLGLSEGHLGSFQHGVTAIKHILNESYNLPVDDYQLFDGSGLSRYTLISPTFIAELLYQLYHDPDFNTFHQALPRAGISGTLDYRMKSPTLAQRVVAKTGSAKGSSSLSGYLKAKSGKVFIFTVIINQSLEKAENLKLIEDKFCELLYDVL